MCATIKEFPVNKSALSTLLFALISVLAADFAHASLSEYLSDSCEKTMTQTRKSIFDPSRVYKTTYPVCADGSASFVQPESSGWWGYEGKCGEVALSNTLKMTCGKAWSPSGAIDSETVDYTPGTATTTMVGALNEFSSYSGCSGKRWTYYDTADSAEEFISSVRDGLFAPSNFTRIREDKTKVHRAPVPILIYFKDEQFLHWVTVVDILGYEKDVKISKQKNCRVVLNQWDDQYTVPCKVIAQMAYDVSSAYYVAGWYLGKYVRIKQE